VLFGFGELSDARPPYLSISYFQVFSLWWMVARAVIRLTWLAWWYLV
jgi:hypothetical protein